MALNAVLLGLINICIVVAILILIGYIVIWLLGLLGFAIPVQVQKIYMVIVALIALYMIVAMLTGAPSWRIVGNSHVPPVKGTIAAPPSIIANSK